LTRPELSHRADANSVAHASMCNIYYRNSVGKRGAEVDRTDEFFYNV
jgi:hypothetical protein